MKNKHQKGQKSKEKETGKKERNIMKKKGKWKEKAGKVPDVASVQKTSKVLLILSCSFQRVVRLFVGLMVCLFVSCWRRGRPVLSGVQTSPMQVVCKVPSDRIYYRSGLFMIV
jgi:hypothetical protein